MVLFQLRFLAWLKSLGTQLVYNKIFLNNLLLGYIKYAYNQRGANVTYTTASLPRQMLTTKLSTMHCSCLVALGSYGHVKINFSDVLNNMNIEGGKCVKSVLGEFISSFSIGRNKGRLLSQIWGPFLRLCVCHCVSYLCSGMWCIQGCSANKDEGTHPRKQRFKNTLKSV